MLSILCVVLFSDGLVRMMAVYMLIKIPISTGIFFLAMYLSSVMVGAVEIGEIHVAVIKSFFLVLIVNLVSLLPFGGFISCGVWVIGLMSFFRLDFWEARMLVFFNWLLNFAVSFFLWMAIIGAVMHSGGRDRDFDDFDRGDRQNAVWDTEDIEDHGGTYMPDPAHPDDHIVTSISFNKQRITDADLAHMKDFPRLTDLNLASTPITDAGLTHLAACKNLQRLTLTRTKVMDAGVENLQKALPKLQIIR